MELATEIVKLLTALVSLAVAVAGALRARGARRRIESERDDRKQ